jgi:hypothetical protein
MRLAKKKNDIICRLGSSLFKPREIHNRSKDDMLFFTA